MLILGAGASMKAGYPSGLGLLKRVEEHFAAEVVDEVTRRTWGWFIQARDSAPAEQALIWNSANPEVIASYLDLCLAGLSSDDEDIERLIRTSLAQARSMNSLEASQGAIDVGAAAVEARYSSALRAPLERARRARIGLMAGVTEYFRFMHWRDMEQWADGPPYLRSRLQQLVAGDVVVTTNYDTLAERTLLGLGLWSPQDGYGFRRPLTTVRPGSVVLPDRPPTPLPAAVLAESQVKVLKLHGSYGWAMGDLALGPRVLGEEEHRLAARLYLTEPLLFGFAASGGPIGRRVYDESTPIAGPDGEPGLVLPTYMKRMATHEMQTIWAQADDALRRVDEVEIIGSGLPEADLGVRVLLNPLRNRLQSGQVKVTLVDPNPETRERWVKLLGSGLIWKRERFE